MYNFLTKNGQLLAFGLGLLVSIIFYLFASLGLEAFNMVPEPDRASSAEGDIFLFGLYATTALLIVAAVAALGFGIFQTAVNPKAALKGIIGIGAMLVLFFALYSMMSTTAPPSLAKILTDFNISEGVHKYINGALSLSMVLMVLAVLFFILSEVRNFFK